MLEDQTLGMLSCLVVDELHMVGTGGVEGAGGREGGGIRWRGREVGIWCRRKLTPTWEQAVLHPDKAHIQSNLC